MHRDNDFSSPEPLKDNYLFQIIKFLEISLKLQIDWLYRHQMCANLYRFDPYCSCSIHDSDHDTFEVITTA